MAYDGAMARKPSLEDYDAGRAGAFLAEHIAGRVQPLYDEPGAHSWEAGYTKFVPASRHASEAAAAEARQRYDAYRDRQRELLEAYRKREDVAAERARAERIERARLEKEWRDKQFRMAVEAEERRLRFEADRAEWERLEEAAQARAKAAARERTIAEAIVTPKWGDEAIVQMAADVPIRWNGYPETGHVTVQAGLAYRVSRQLAGALLKRGLCWIIT